MEIIVIDTKKPGFLGPGEKISKNGSGQFI